MKRVLSLVLALTLLVGLGMELAMPTYAAAMSTDNRKNLELSYSETGTAKTLIKISSYSIFANKAKVRIGDSEFQAKVSTQLLKGLKYRSVFTIEFDNNGYDRRAKTYSLLGIHGDKNDTSVHSADITLTVNGSYFGLAIAGKEAYVNLDVNCTSKLTIPPKSNGTVYWELKEVAETCYAVVVDSKTRMHVNLDSTAIYEKETSAWILYQMYKQQTGEIYNSVNEDIGFLEDLGFTPTKYVEYNAKYTMKNVYSKPRISVSMKLVNDRGEEGVVRVGEFATVYITIKNLSNYPVEIEVSEEHDNWGWIIGSIVLTGRGEMTITFRKRYMTSDVKIGTLNGSGSSTSAGNATGWDYYQFHVSGSEAETPIINKLSMITYRVKR